MRSDKLEREVKCVQVQQPLLLLEIKKDELQVKLQTNIEVDGWMGVCVDDGWVAGWGWVDGRMDGCVCKDGWMGG